MLKKHIVISVLATDRPGIIADVAGIIYELQGDLADMSQSVLNGFFSMIILTRFDESVTIETIEEKLKGLESSDALDCIVREASESDFHFNRPEGDVYVVTAQGQNRTGLVASVSSYCRDKGINIIGYETKLSGESYNMMLDIVLPSGLSPDEIHKDLDKTADELGLKIVMQHKDLFETVNEISLL